MHAVECKACTSSASECACVSHNSRLIKLLHSNEPCLSVWQLLWQPLFTTSPPTHMHHSARTNMKHTTIVKKASRADNPCTPHVATAVVKSLGKLC